MEGDFYIGNRKRKKCTRRRRMLRFLCALFVIVLAMMLWFHFALFPQAKARCVTALSNRLEALANEKAYSFLSGGEYAYDDFIKLSYGAEGAVRSATVDTVKLNVLKTQLATAVLTALHSEYVTADVSVGNLTGLLLFSGRGGEIRVSAQVAEEMHARFHTVFTSAGINQTRHAIGFSLDFTAAYFLASHREMISFSVQIPIGETLIVGEVPDSLTQINRLLDDVTEIEIDDAVDFGNVIS